MRKNVLYLLLLTALLWVPLQSIASEKKDFGTLFVKTKSTSNKNLEFIYRVPENYDENSRILILFGGRNWNARKTIETYKFNEFADKNKLFLISPSFQDDDYWEPAKWSGAALFSAVNELEKLYKLNHAKLFYYGYSAGGQCVVLFYNYAPERVAAWALHASGVYFDPKEWKGIFASGLITCGMDDYVRYKISMNFILNFREAGGRVIWIPYSKTDHALTNDALDAAKQFLEDQINDKKAFTIGEDDTKQSFEIDSAEGEKIPLEYRNYITSEELLKSWRIR